MPYILPITVVILIALFSVQRSGTAKVATFFGPVMVVFFTLIGFLGVIHIADAPVVLDRLRSRGTGSASCSATGRRAS